MGVSYALLSVAATVVAMIAAAFIFSSVIWPMAIYVYTYLTRGRAEAEEKALDAMGENKLSYGLKDQLKRTRLTDNKGLNDIQDAVTDTIGGQLSGDGAGAGLGDGLSKGL